MSDIGPEHDDTERGDDESAEELPEGRPATPHYEAGDEERGFAEPSPDPEEEPSHGPEADPDTES